MAFRVTTLLPRLHQFGPVLDGGDIALSTSDRHSLQPVKKSIFELLLTLDLRPARLSSLGSSLLRPSPPSHCEHDEPHKDSNGDDEGKRALPKVQ